MAVATMTAASTAGAGGSSGLAGALGSIGGGLLSSGGSIFGSKKSSKTAKKIAAMQIAWEKERAQNAIQWGVQDAIKAGINPAVAAGSPANTSGINPPMPDTSGYTTAGQQLNAGINNAISYKQAETAQKLAESQGFKNAMEGLEAGERTNAIPEQLKNMTRDSLTAMARQRAEERNQDFQNRLLEQQTAYQTLENSIKEIEKEINTGNYGKALAFIDRTTETIKNAGGAISSFIPTLAMWKGAKSVGDLKDMISTFKKSNAFKLMNNFKTR